MDYVNLFDVTLTDTRGSGEFQMFNIFQCKPHHGRANDIHSQRIRTANQHIHGHHTPGSIKGRRIVTVGCGNKTVYQGEIRTQYPVNVGKFLMKAIIVISNAAVLMNKSKLIFNR